ncbi:heterokaryon incompatibility protein-domain-containing protein [Bisporella sp. PMI_857]|nr:heterokaryon incompatibility protein-domain-containing protein [Bisporella sp. PMI_857]
MFLYSGLSLPSLTNLTNIAYYSTLEKETSTEKRSQREPPILQTISAPYFQLLRKWLENCGQHHNCSQREQYWSTRKQCDNPEQYWPTVIFAGNPDLKKLKLQKLEKGQDYIVLSHCWGTPPDLKGRQKRKTEGFSYDDLPKIFQDAVQVTRELGIKYLWIDALCIVQNDKEEWKKEGKHMENVFASAYCTIAASSSPSWEHGFLERKLSPQYFQVYFGANGRYGRNVYVCDNTNDFSNDVDEGSLSGRAWVLQERMLSRRTIHFSENQTYWECGNGVICENFTQLTCPPERKQYVLDSNFPQQLKKSGYDSMADFFQFLFKRYTECGITVKSDRKVAISGLIQRIESTFKTEARYGIFSYFLSKLLLWKRADGKEKTAPIVYQDGEVPSWSWMAYDGEIDFISSSRLMVPDYSDLRFAPEQNLSGSLSEAELMVRGFWKRMLMVQVRRLKNCHMEQGEPKCTIIADGRSVGTLWFDMKITESFPDDVVVVGMDKSQQKDSKQTYYILAVKKEYKAPRWSAYVRLGVGEIEAQYVSNEGNGAILM